MLALPHCSSVLDLDNDVIGIYQDGTDMYGYLLRNRVIFVGSRINDEVTSALQVLMK